jgi:ADP-heptose:LPS heptosyltransferase
MNTDLMRFIDYWVVVPICFLLEAFDCLVRLLPENKKENPAPGVLYIKLSEMGGIILSYSLILKIQNDYPGSKTFFLTFKKNKPIVEALKVIPQENILTIRDDSFINFLLDTLRVIARMRRERIDIAFDLELFSRFTAILTYLSGAKKRIGNFHYYFEGLYRGNLLTHNVQYNPLLHTSKSFYSMEQVVKLDKKTSPELERRIAEEEIKLPRYLSPQEEIDNIWSKLAAYGIERGARLILVNPGDGIIPLREWPIENFVSLIKMFLNDERNRAVIIGTEGASFKSGQILKSVNDKRCVDITGKTSISEVFGLFSVATALVANDCGLAHIASLTSLKKFILFGPESPQMYSPLGGNTFILYSDFPCSPCLSSFNHRRSACRDNRCLKTIKPEEVFRVIKENT